MTAQLRKLLHCVLALTVALLILRPALAEDEECRANIEIEVAEFGVPLLSHIPYMNRLFTNVGVPIGVVSCENECCQVAGPGQLRVVCQQACCPQLAVSQVPPAVGSENCQGKQGLEGISKLELVTSLTEALSRVAALEAVLEARNEFEEHKEELMQSLAEASSENARLEAQVEHFEHRLALQAEMGHTLAENARLQAKLEFAAHKEKLAKAYSQTIAENRKLKAHLAKLQYAGSASQVAVSKQDKHAGKKSYKLQNKHIHSDVVPISKREKQPLKNPHIEAQKVQR